MNINGVSGASHRFEPRVEDQDPAPSPTEAEHPSATDDIASGTSVLLLEGDMGAQVAALAILSAQKQRDSNRDVQVAEETALEQAENAQVAALHEKAGDIRMAGYVEGGFGMVSGACTMGAGFATTDSAKLEWKGLATVSEGGGKYLGGLPKAAQSDDDANAATHEHEAAHHRRNLDAAHDAIREGQDLLERALDFYKQSQQGEAEAANSSLRRS